MAKTLDRLYFRDSPVAEKKDLYCFLCSTPTSDWISTIQSIICSRTNISPGDVRDLVLLGIKYENPLMRPRTFALNDANIENLLRICSTTKEAIEELFFFVSLSITSMPFGSTVSRYTDKPQHTFMYSSYQTVADCFYLVRKRFICEGAAGEQVPKGAENRVCLAFDDCSLVSEDDFLPCMIALPEYMRTVYLFTKQSSYSELTAMVLMNFTFPDLQNNVDIFLLSAIHEKLLKKESSSIANELRTYTNRIKTLMADRNAEGRCTSEEGRQWEIARELQLLADVTPSLLTMNEALRRLIINPFVLRACKILKGSMLVDSNLCENQVIPPPAFLGTGPIDIMISSAVAVLNEPDLEDIPVPFMYEDPDEDDEIRREIRAMGVYRGLGAAHDMMLEDDIPALHHAAAAPSVYTSGQKRGLESLDSTPVVYKVSKTALVLSSGHSWRLYVLTKPQVEGGKVTVRYGGELSLPVLHFAAAAPSWRERSARSGGAASQGAPVDEGQVVAVLCMLAWAGTKE